MKLYEVDSRIEEILYALEPDPETGEIAPEWEELDAELQKLLMKRDEILQYLAKLVLNTRSSTEALRTEERRLATRRKTLERKEEALMKILDRECGGENADLGVAVLRYRSTEHLEVSDEVAAINFLKENGNENCYRIPQPELSKSETKALVKSGVEVPGVSIVSRKSCSLR